MKTAGQQVCDKRGFSLVEVMVAVTLLAVITIGLLSMFYHTQRAFRLGTGQVDTLESGRAALQLIRRDLQEMHPSQLDYVPNLEATSGPVRIVQTLPFGPPRTNLLQDISFLSQRGSEWIATTYRIYLPFRGAGTLYRRVDSVNVALLATNFPLTVRPRDALTNLAYNIRRYPVNPAVTNVPFDRILDGVIHFSVKPYDGIGVPYALTNSLFALRADPGGSGEGHRFTNEVPAYLDLELAIVDPAAMKQFERRLTGTAGAIAQARTYLEEQGYRTHVFKQRIAIHARRGQSEFFAAQ